MTDTSMLDPDAPGTEPSLLPAVTSALAPDPALAVPAIRREKPEVDEARKALVNRRWRTYELDKKHHDPAFKKMRADQDFVAGIQYPDQISDDDERYVANIVFNHMRQRVSALYARRPKVVARRRKRMDFEIWDGTAQSLQTAQAALMPPPIGNDPATGQPIWGPVDPMWQPDPNAVALMRDVEQGWMRRKLFDKVARTLELLFDYTLSEQVPNFKESMKQLIRRVETCGVGYVEIDFQRAMEKKPETASRIADISTRLATIERLTADLQDGTVTEDSAEAEELRLTMAALKEEPEVIVREGLLFHFPTATEIIPDRKTRHLKGFVGADHVHKEMLLTVDVVKEVYEIDVSGSFTAYRENGDVDTTPVYDEPGKDHGSKLARVVHTYDRKTGLVFCMCEGYPDFLKEPYAPKLKLEQFFPWYALTFNDLEHDEQLYPPSDARLLRHPQREYNRTKESLRQHRIANRPLYVTPTGTFEDDDTVNLTKYNAHDVVALNGLEQGENVENKLQPLKKVPIDPNVYETEQIFQDVLRIAGSSEASMGAANPNTTATGDSIAETNRISSLASNADDLNELLTAMARDGGQVLFMELDIATVKKIAGPGAVWPEFSRQETAEEIFLEIAAGSTGRPNQAQEIANFERLAPTMLQTPSISPEWLAKKQVSILDDQVDYEDAILSGIPSITAINGAVQPGTGDPATDPNQQGPQGAQNQPAGPGFRGGPQPAFPAAPGGAQMAGR